MDSSTSSSDRSPRRRAHPFPFPQHMPAPPDFLLPPYAPSERPIPLNYSSSYTSDADSEPSSPLLPMNRRHSWWTDDSHSSRWWSMGDRRRRRQRSTMRRETLFGFRTFRRRLRWIVRLLPQQPTTILLTILTFTVVALIITLTLIHILNPDKASLPWRAYCAIPPTSRTPPSLTRSPTDDLLMLTLPHDIDPTSPEAAPYMKPFPPPDLDLIPPAGVFLGVFSTDSAVERRMLIRTTWASHPRSRSGADPGDQGRGTSRSVVRFILGKPRRDWERRIQLEADTYNDIIVLPIAENMNAGKTHAFFTWAAENAWVPAPTRWSFSYSNESAVPPPLAPHDPDPQPASASAWVRPDYVVKADDDSFIMLAELESRLRVELDDAFHSRHDSEPFAMNNGTTALLHDDTGLHQFSKSASTSPAAIDPLIYWGYLVKNSFMAGELYSLSFPLVQWVANEPSLTGMTRGAEDKQTAKWIRAHPRANEVRWASERCWIYDHPRAGTVYSHGFLFPSEVARVKKNILSFLIPRKPRGAVAGTFAGDDDADEGVEPKQTALTINPAIVVEPPVRLLAHIPRATAPSLLSSSKDASPNNASSPTPSNTTTYILPPPNSSPAIPSYSYSSVTHFGTHYTFPLPSLTATESIEALIEGSSMSSLFEGGPIGPQQAWASREGRRTRYEGGRLGGTVVVHFIKRNEWWFETAEALLGGADVIREEEEEKQREKESNRVSRLQKNFKVVEDVARPGDEENAQQ